MKADMGRVREEKRREEKRREEKRREEKRREEKGRKRRKRIKEETVRRKKMQVREKVEESRNTVFQWFMAPEGRKVGALKQRCGAIWPDERWKIVGCFGAKHMSKSKCTKRTNVEPLLEVEMSKKCTPLWREAHFKVKSVKNWRSRSTFGSWHVEIVHAVVALSTFRSQKCKKLRGTEHFRTFGCRFAWQAQGILHLAKIEQNVRVL